MEDTGGGSKSATMERIMADFPKHNWLFNKYNTVSKDDGTNSSRNTQVCFQVQYHKNPKNLYTQEKLL